MFEKKVIEEVKYVIILINLYVFLVATDYGKDHLISLFNKQLKEGGVKHYYENITKISSKQLLKSEILFAHFLLSTHYFSITVRTFPLPEIRRDAKYKNYPSLENI